jgi:hypothetical protein
LLLLLRPYQLTPSDSSYYYVLSIDFLDSFENRHSNLDSSVKKVCVVYNTAKLSLK